MGVLGQGHLRAGCPGSPLRDPDHNLIELSNYTS
jgi:hypothetical protein